MSPKRTPPGKGGKIRRVPKTGRRDVSRAEFDAVVTLLKERGKIIEELRQELHATCREIAEQNRRELQTQLTRIAQLQQEIDALKRHLS